MPPPGPTHKRIGEILMAQGAIEQGELNDALMKQEELSLRQKLGSVLVLMGVVDEDTVAQAIGEQLGLPWVDPLDAPVDAALVWRVPRRVAEQHLVLPLERPISGGRPDASAVRVAMAEPNDLDRISELEFLLECHVDPEVASSSALKEAIARHYDTSSLPGRTVSDVPRESRPPVTSPTGRELDERAILSALERDPTSRAVMDHIVINAIERGADTIRFEPQSGGMRVRFRLDHAMHTALQVPSAAVKPLLDLVRSLGEGPASADAAATSTTKQYGGFQCELRIATWTDESGTGASIAIVDPDSHPRHLDALGMAQASRDGALGLLDAPKGLVLVIGPPGSGRATTVRALAATLDGRAFEVLGDLATPEDSQRALALAEHGLCLATLDAPTAPATLERLRDLGMASDDIKSNLVGMINQRLLRKVCPTCSRPARANTDDWLRAGVSPIDLGADARRRGPGCPRCAYTGHNGKVAVFEVIDSTSPVSGTEVDEPDGPSLLEHALHCVMRGLSTLDDVTLEVPSGLGRRVGGPPLLSSAPSRSRSSSPPPPSDLPFDLPPLWSPLKGGD